MVFGKERTPGFELVSIGYHGRSLATTAPGRGTVRGKGEAEEGCGENINKLVNLCTRPLLAMVSGVHSSSVLHSAEC